MRPYYDQGGITLYHGDCRDVLPALAPGSVDVLLTDPPYGMAFAGNGKATRNANIRGDGAGQGARLTRQALFAADGLLAPDAHAYVFCHWRSWPDFYDAVAAYLPIKNALVWWKARGGMGNLRTGYAPDYEVVLYAARGPRPLLGRRDGCVIAGIPPVGSNRSHPTEKPVDLLRYLIGKSCPTDGRVLDPFAGAGATLLAAQALGRRAIGVEIEERYCEVAVRRLTEDADG